MEIGKLQLLQKLTGNATKPAKPIMLEEKADAVSLNDERFVSEEQIQFCQDFLASLNTTLIECGFALKGERPDWGKYSVRSYMNSQGHRFDITLFKAGNGTIINSAFMYNQLNEALFGDRFFERIIFNDNTNSKAANDFSMLMYAITLEYIRKTIILTDFSSLYPTQNVMASIRSGQETIEEAKIFPKNRYIWYSYKGPKTAIDNTAKKRKANFVKGYVFGVRPANSRPNMYRMITKEHGETIVFTLKTIQLKKLILNSKVTDQPE